MKKEYIIPQIVVISIDVSTVIASSMNLNRSVVSDIDELAVKDDSWGDIWDDNYGVEQ